MKAGLPFCLIGDSGTGKSHLLIGIGTDSFRLPQTQEKRRRTY
ncbi:hypothetical protein GCM10010389_33290 [Streptomyces echinoruber]|uniref:Uncharacterized protein n=1 Tax=Streptomyces echinoruber TaxID=68898 RepID=A0A918RAN5_9ACTN|nr:hypothetical protein GCM10010389_33290 [Streptomyces echinoruber]